MKPYLTLVLVFALTFLFFSCNENPTDSRPRIIRPPQEMIWTADTLKGFDQYAQLTPENLLVFSANDAWLVCWSDIARRLIWHFDGKTWHESNIAADVGGMRVNDIAGYSSNDLWTCGYTGDEIFLAHYDGNNWIKYNTNGIKGELLDMCKDADGNLWACGRYGLVMKFDKNKWHTTYLLINKLNQADYWVNCIGSKNNEIHVSISRSDLINKRNVFYHMQGSWNNFALTDSMVLINPSSVIKWGTYEFSSSNNRLFSLGPGGVWAFNNNWENTYLYDSAIFDIWESENNYTIVVGDEKIVFNNGGGWTDIQSVFKITNPLYRFRNIWTSGYETFIVGYNLFDRAPKITVWRGK